MIDLGVLKRFAEGCFDFVAGQEFLGPFQRFLVGKRDDSVAAYGFVLLASAPPPAGHRPSGAGKKESARARGTVETRRPVRKIAAVSLGCLADEHGLGSVIAQSVDDRFHVCSPCFDHHNATPRMTGEARQLAFLSATPGLWLGCRCCACIVPRVSMWSTMHSLGALVNRNAPNGCSQIIIGAS
jgi:hypothetical protein